MKFLFIPILVLLAACSDSKETKAPGDTTPSSSSDVKAKNAGAGNSSEDNNIVEWLVGKEWKAELGAAPFSILKVYSRDTCGYATGRDHWTFKNSRFEMFGAEWPFVKVNDTSFTIYVEPTKKTFAYNFVKKL